MRLYTVRQPKQASHYCKVMAQADMSAPSLPVVSAFPPTPETASSTIPHKSATKPRHVSSARSMSAGSRGRSKSELDLPRRKRVQSAVEKRQSVNLSADSSPWCSKVWGETSYHKDFPPKKPFPNLARPSSATRMNNPHPSQSFLVWRIPSRIHKHERAVSVDPSWLKDADESFYKDYTLNNRKTDRAMYEVPILNVAKIPFPGENKLTGFTLKGTQIPLSNGNEELLDAEILRPQSKNAVQEWSKHASNAEKEVFEKMLRAAQIEETKTKKVLSKVFNPSSMTHIKKWLSSVDENEHKTAMNVLEDLALRSQRYDSSRPHHQTKKAITKPPLKSHTWPRQKPSVNHSSLGIQGVSVVPRGVSNRCMDCGDIIQKKQRSLKAPEVLWHHKVKPPQQSRTLNSGAMFGQPQKLRGQHFAIHPEWPIA